MNDRTRLVALLGAIGLGLCGVALTAIYAIRGLEPPAGIVSLPIAALTGILALYPPRGPVH